MDKKKLMYIDDDSDDQEFFLDASYAIPLIGDTQIFGNARAALDFLEKATQLPDVIFLDLNMPVMDGFEFLERKESMKQLQRIPVIVLTTSNRPEMKNKSLQLGAKSFITKPTSIDGLVTEVQDTLDMLFSASY